MEDLNNPPDVSTHIRETRESLAEIEKDIHCLMDMEKKEAKDMTEGFDSGMLAGLLSNKGIDPSIMAVLNDKCRDGNWGDGGMLIVLFLILILGFGGNGGWFGNRNGGCAEAAGIDRTIFNQSNFDILNSAISTQGTRQEMAINQLAGNLNCDCNTIKSALGGLDKQLALTNGNVINAIQNVGCQLGQQISACCCETRRAIENQGCQTRADIQDVRFLISSSQAAQDNLIQSQFAAQNAYLADQFCQIKMRELESTNQRLRDEIFRQSQNAQTAQILTAIANKDAISFSGTAGATAFTGTGSIS